MAGARGRGGAQGADLAVVEGGEGGGGGAREGGVWRGGDMRGVEAGR